MLDLTAAKKAVRLGYPLAVCAVASALISLFWLRIPRSSVSREELVAAE